MRSASCILRYGVWHRDGSTGVDGLYATVQMTQIPLLVPRTFPVLNGYVPMCCKDDTEYRNKNAERCNLGKKTLATVFISQESAAISARIARSVLLLFFAFFWWDLDCRQHVFIWIFFFLIHHAVTQSARQTPSSFQQLLGRGSESSKRGS